MKNRKDYSKSPAPRYDALQDVIKFLDDRWPKCNEHLKPVTNVDQFENWAGFAGVEGAPVEAWYDHIHGEGAWVIAGGTSQFSDGMAVKPMTIRRSFAQELIKDIRNKYEGKGFESFSDFANHPLYNLGPDELSSAEEWVQKMLERSERINSEEDEVLFQDFIKQIEIKLIDQMAEKVLDQVNSLANDQLTIGYVLHGLNRESLFKVVDFLNSYKNRLED